MIEIFGDKSLFETNQREEIAEQQWVEVSLRDLSRQFNYNSVVAEDRWIGKRILTKATVDYVDDGFSDDSVTVSMNDGFGIDLECNHRRRDKSFRSVGRGRKVWVIGTLYGESTGLKMYGCKYSQTKPFPAGYKKKRESILSAKFDNIKAERAKRKERRDNFLQYMEIEKSMNIALADSSDPEVRKTISFLRSLPETNDVTDYMCIDADYLIEQSKLHEATLLMSFRKCARVVERVRSLKDNYPQYNMINDRYLMDNRERFRYCDGYDKVSRLLRCLKQ